jgi:cell wall-associated NlpC family hydrolase
MDCSGYVKNVFGKLGVKLPRRATHQMAVGQVISRYEDLKPGDRLYFSDRKHTRISHTGIYLGKGYFIHANSSAKKVSISYLITKRWMSICVAARR